MVAAILDFKLAPKAYYSSRTTIYHSCINWIQYVVQFPKEKNLHVLQQGSMLKQCQAMATILDFRSASNLKKVIRDYYLITQLESISKMVYL